MHQLTRVGLLAALVLATSTARAQTRTGDGSKAVPLGKKTAAPATPSGGTGAPGGNSAAASGASSMAAASTPHKPTLAPTGTWTWTSYSPSMQPEENTITLTSDGHGKVTATLTDWLGRHDIKAVTVNSDSVSFDVLYHYRGFGDFAHTFTISLDPDTPTVAVQRPDFSSLGKAHAGKRTATHPAKHAAS